MPQDLAQKLLIKPDTRVLLLNAPIGYAKKLAPLPSGVTVTDKRGMAEVAIAFVRDSAELKRLASGFPALEEDAVLWVAYPKGGAKTATDIDLDTLHAAMEKHELVGETLVALDDTWSAMRFRAPDEVAS